MDEGETLERLVQELVDAIGEAEVVMGEAMDVARAVAADEDADTAADGVTSEP
ncbi:hypothetical protein GCM10009837_26130 [Streptomyces durmitorensis]|uniref:Uncharacterized protein n=1 Tax=Streptomyces durmitorensis TaxID=319947 RepID=A0ABY4PUE7_9ACTN|nr:hypothetical protein [Streptomyces durmitorensis]UQT56725.1 hypothetical protein M4V62_17370 [Streptomyces durmitorensis]